MSVDLHVLRRCLASLMLLVGAIGADTSAVAQSVTVDETVQFCAAHARASSVLRRVRLHRLSSR